MPATIQKMTQLLDLHAIRSKVEQLRELVTLYHNPCPETEAMKLEIEGALETICEVTSREIGRLSKGES